MKTFVVIDTHATCFSGGAKVVQTADHGQAEDAALLAGAEAPIADVQEMVPGCWWVMDAKSNALAVVLRSVS